jgi:hypothetical protein
MAVIALGLSCKDEKTEEANKTVDCCLCWLIRKCSSGDAKANWSSIEATYEVRSSQAETALSDLKGSEDAKAKVEASKTKYAALQARIQADASCSAKF